MESPSRRGVAFLFLTICLHVLPSCAANNRNRRTKVGSKQPYALESRMRSTMLSWKPCLLCFRNPPQYDRAWKAKKRTCERENCAHLIPDESMNCVNECTSESCYAQIYAAEPLEDGEVDLVRARAFTTCLRNEMRDSRHKKNRENKQKKKEKKEKKRKAKKGNKEFGEAEEDASETTGGEGDSGDEGTREEDGEDEEEDREERRSEEEEEEEEEEKGNWGGGL